MKKIFSLIGVIFFSLSLNVSCKENVIEGPKVEERTLNFYALNDFHGSYLYDEDYKQTGLSRIGDYLINRKIGDPENTFILSSGDMFQGGAESNITYGKVVIDTMNAIGFDAMAIGNHEFDWDEDILKEMVDQMEFPLLGINVFYEDQSNNNSVRPDYLDSSVVIEKEGIRVGIIGAIQPNIDSSIIASVSSKFYYKDSIDLIKEEAERLREDESCDVVVLSSHDGSSSRYKRVSDVVDAVFLGHDHDKKEGRYDNGVPYIEGGSNGNYLSHIALNLKLNKSTNRYEVVSSSYNNMETFNNPTFSYTSDIVEDVYSKYKDEIEVIRDEVLYDFKFNVSSGSFAKYISYSLKEYATNVYPKLPIDNGIINNGGVRSNISEGEFTYGDLIKVYPFENKLYILEFDNYYSYKSFISSKQNVVPSDTNQNESGKYYVATIDYVALQSYGYSKLIPTDDFARDIVADNLKNNGYIAI